MPVTALAHVCVRTRDLAACERFYVDLLGFERLFRFTRRGAVIGCYLRLAERMFLEVFTDDAAAPSGARNRLSHFCLECRDLSGLRARLAAAGVAVGPLRLGADRTHQFWAPDPDGVSIEFQEYTAESAQFRGGDVEVDW